MESSKGSTDAQLSELLTEAFAGDPIASGFEVHYQPIVRLEDDETVAVEALLRWWHPRAGRIEPDVFEAVADRAGLTAAMQTFALEQACADVAALADAYGTAVDVHVRVSASRFGKRELDSALAGALRRHAVPADRLVLGIVATTHIDSLAAATAAAQRLQELGVRLALDDLGAGFDALLQLHAWPIDFVKLDAAAASVGFDQPRGKALCLSVLQISARLGATVIAEGIDTESQAEALARLGCRFGQGYLYGMPLRLRHWTPRSVQR